MIKSFFSLLFVVCIPFLLRAQNNLSALIPYPNQVTQKLSRPPFQIRANTTISANKDSLSFEIKYLQKVIKESMDLDISFQKVPPKKQAIFLSIDPTITGKEQYILDISKNKIAIKGQTKAGIFYGITTLRQLLLGDKVHTQSKEIPAIRIEDQPRIAQRMLMLDPARHFLPVEDVKTFINQMVKFKYNTLQIHLTDDQGWRIEIKKYPRLTNIGAFRNLNGEKEGPDNGFYSQKEMKELIRYAAARHISIVPELDIPGHTTALLAAYPELACTSVDTSSIILGKTTQLMVCAGNPKVYEMYKNILTEVAALFPSNQIHLGGDESALGENWAQCEKDQALREKLHLESDTAEMQYFFSKILSEVDNLGKTAILWCELDNIRPPAKKYLFPYPKNTILVAWRMGLTPKCMELTEQSGHKIILAPGEYCYFDYPQYKNDLPEFNNWGMPITTLKKTYEFDPGYGLSPNRQKHILGVMGTLWGEAIKDINRAFYMTYPRAMALAEAGWTNSKNRNWESFKKRIYPNLSHLMKTGISFRVPFEIVED